MDIALLSAIAVQIIPVPIHHWDRMEATVSALHRYKIAGADECFRANPTL